MTPGSYTSNKPEIPRAAFVTVPKPCEDALLDLCNAYNKLADRVEEAWALLQEAEPILELRGYPSLSHRIRETLP